MDSDTLNDRIARLSPVKRALLEQRLKQRNGSANWSIPRRQTSGPVRLSFGQERLWFLNQLEPESSAYNEGRSVSVTGDLDLGALEGSLRQIVRRHQGLRTIFLNQDGIPLQVVSDEREFTLEVLDLRWLPDAEPAMRAR